MGLNKLRYCQQIVLTNILKDEKETFWAVAQGNNLMVVGENIHYIFVLFEKLYQYFFLAITILFCDFQDIQ